MTICFYINKSYSKACLFTFAFRYMMFCPYLCSAMQPVFF
uniref:Uncharacterized protein n=1 Tax=Anguilla anguilla TaxID=7936 RepID=A0A0E9WJX0_ANGAN